MASPFQLSGSLEEIPLTDIARLIQSTRKSGQLVLTSGNSSGSIYFDRGDMVDCQATNMAGIDALKHVALFNRGAFDFVDGVAPSSKTLLAHDTAELIDLLENRMLESRQLQELMPDLSDIPRYQGGAIPAGLELNAADLAVALRSAAGTQSVSQLAAALNLDETTVCYTVARFRAAGLIDIVGQAESVPDAVAPAVPPPVSPKATAPVAQPRYWRGRKIEG
jgi:hypothetical protein